MENYLELLVFLAFAAFSFLSRFLNKKKKAPNRETGELEGANQPEKPVVDPERPQSEPVSFEDILREMMGESKPRTAKKPKAQPPVKPVPSEIKEEVQSAKQTTKQARQAAKKSQRITDKISLEDTGKRIKAIDLTEQKNTVAQEVAQALSTPKSAREAIILSEIIKRKYI